MLKRWRFIPLHVKSYKHSSLKIHYYYYARAQCKFKLRCQKNWVEIQFNIVAWYDGQGMKNSFSLVHGFSIHVFTWCGSSAWRSLFIPYAPLFPVVRYLIAFKFVLTPSQTTAMDLKTKIWNAWIVVIRHEMTNLHYIPLLLLKYGPMTSKSLVKSRQRNCMM